MTEALNLSADNPCDGDCGGSIGRNWRICQKGSCFDVYCRECFEDHDLRVHVGPHERAILAAWRMDAEQRQKR